MKGCAREPGLAALMSIPFPGLGHVWCGRLGRGLAAMALVHAAQVAMTSCFFVRPSGWVVATAVAAGGFGALVVGLAVIDAMRIAVSVPADRPLGELQRPAVYLLFIATSLAVPFVCIAATGGRSLQSFRMASSSMRPAIQRDDLILVNRAAYRRRAIERRDVVAYEPTGGKSLLVHRVVGLPGDTLECDDGRVLLNGEPVRGAVGGATGPSNEREVLSFDFDPVTVPEDHVFVMGDSAGMSRDSRMDGCVPVSSIAGRVDWVLVSPTRNSLMSALDGTR